MAHAAASKLMFYYANRQQANGHRASQDSWPNEVLGDTANLILEAAGGTLSGKNLFYFHSSLSPQTCSVVITRPYGDQN